jgi:rhodanese-related sulfurtransferase
VKAFAGKRLANPGAGTARCFGAGRNGKKSTARCQKGCNGSKLVAMNWTALVIAAAAIGAFLAFRHSGLISVNDARAFLKSGAMVIDVRTAGEFVAGHLPNAVNLPVHEVESSVTRVVRDKNQVLLVHCQSGSRGGAARKKLRAMGYSNTFCLGDYARASQIVSGK